MYSFSLEIHSITKTNHLNPKLVLLPKHSISFLGLIPCVASNLLNHIILCPSLSLVSAGNTTPLHICLTLAITVSEIKVLLCAPTGCISPKTVHPGFSPCTLLICSNNRFSKKRAHSRVHRKSCTRPWKCARQVQGAPLISDTA